MRYDELKHVIAKTKPRSISTNTDKKQECVHRTLIPPLAL